MKKYKRVVDNRMRGFGDTDFNKKVIRVNKKRSKKHGELLDTIVHEETHRKHPKMHEKNVRKTARRKIKKMSTRVKKKNFALYSKRSKRRT